MIKTTLSIALGTILLLSGCAKINTISNSQEVTSATKAYNQANDAITLVNNGVSEVDKLKQSCSNTMDSFSKTLKGKEATKNISDANETMQTVLGLIACAPKNIDTNIPYKNRLYPYVTKNSSSKKILFPITSSKMSIEEGGCLNIEKINQYKKLTSNVFTFDALYSSPLDGTKTTIQYRMVKDNKSKQWLFRF